MRRGKQAENPGLELDRTDTVTIQSEGPAERPPSPRREVSVSLSGAVKAAAHWASYTCNRWKQAARQHTCKKRSGELLEVRYKGLAEDDEGDEEESDMTDGAVKRQQLNKRLLDHFRELAASNQDTDQVDLQYLSDVLSEGADPNSTDRYGQTVLHEISRAWSVDVMRFFLERGSDLHRPDAFGVTALHVAAALDYREMMHYLLDNNADVEARTSQDLQTPLHYAAKNEALGAIRVLLEAGGDISARDYKHRTPLQLAANMDRSEAVCVLLELGADAGVKDSDGQLCITAMIGRMTPVARLALSRFHVTDRMTRQQFYYLNLLEPEPSSEHHLVVTEPTSPLEAIIRQGSLDLVMHPVVLKLIQIKWNLYGRLGAWLLLILNFLFIVAWTTLAISVSALEDVSQTYIFPQGWWRVLLVVLALGLTVEEVLREVKEICSSRRKLLLWRNWSERRLNQDLVYSHPMWPEETHFLQDQIRHIHKMKGSYSQDLWNVFDWLVYCLLLAAFGIHVAAVFLLSSSLHNVSLRLFAVTIIFLWLRLMKHVRAFRVMGPFIVMLGKIAGDVMRFLFLYAEIFIPYACAFWMIFGGMEAVPSMRTVPALLYSLYRITLVDEYQFDAMVTVDPIMASLLCGTFLALSSILCVNLLIALLSDTFQRVYDNAQANAVMQQASIILQVEESMPLLRRFYDNQHIHRHCAPLAESHDDDITTSSAYHQEMTKITSQIKDTLDDFLDLQRQSRSLDQTQQLTEQVSEGRCCSPQQEDEEEQLWAFQNLLEWQEQQTQELQAIRADLKELQNLLEQLVRTRTCPGKAQGEEAESCHTGF